MLYRQDKSSSLWQEHIVNLKQQPEKALVERRKRLERVLALLLELSGRPSEQFSVRQWSRLACHLVLVLDELRHVRRYIDWQGRGLRDGEDLHRHKMLRQEVARLNPAYSESDLRLFSLKMLEDLRKALRAETESSKVA